MSNVSAYILKSEISQTNNLMMYTNIFKKQERTKPNSSWKEVVKIKAEINEI